MSGFDLTKMLPLYLDESDELIASMNDALLRLEQTPDDAKALQEAFRYVHTIKGSSALMGFEPVKELTHQLETIFDQLRSKKRLLDLPVLELFFQCLDGLRDFHQDLRTSGSSQVDLSKLTSNVVARLAGDAERIVPRAPEADSPTAPEPIEAAKVTEDATLIQSTDLIDDVNVSDDVKKLGLRITFEPGLQLADMKARLVLNRLASRARVLRSDPPGDRFEDVENLTGMVVWLAAGETESNELKALADVDGVLRVEFIQTEPSTEPASAVERAQEPEIVRPPKETPPPNESPPVSSQPEPTNQPRVAETVRVDIDRLDSLMNLAGELVINKARFAQVSSGLEALFRASSAQLLATDTQDRLDSLERLLATLSDQLQQTGNNGSVERWQTQFRALRENFRAIVDELDLIRQGRERVTALAEAINQLARVTDGIQKGVLNTRMVPIGPLFGRFRRVVRDLSVSSGKEVVLRVSGEKTELDKRMIDELGDPLVHMIRNSVDHGLEAPEHRERTGKPRAGTVTLAAAHRGNSVVITVADDGRGIDVERLRRKAVSHGLLSEADARRSSDRELIQFIWHPGLSTAESITDISGRGVGMDIVRSRIEALNGSVDVRTVPGQGTTFSIRLPLTLAIMPSLLVRIYEEVYAVPLDHVDEIVEAPPAMVHRVQGQRTIDIRRRVVGLVALNDVFRWSGGDHPALGQGIPRTETTGKLTVVVVQDGETTVGLIVDELIGIQEVVLKSLERNFRAIRGLSGASILGDGRVSLILDVDAVIEMAGQSAEKEQIRARSHQAVAAWE